MSPIHTGITNLDHEAGLLEDLAAHRVLHGLAVALAAGGDRPRPGVDAPRLRRITTSIRPVGDDHGADARDRDALSSIALGPEPARVDRHRHVEPGSGYVVRQPVIGDEGSGRPSHRRGGHDPEPALADQPEEAGVYRDRRRWRACGPR